MTMDTFRTAVTRIGALVCVLLFVYQAWQCFLTYSRHSTVTKMEEVDQARWPLPKICVTSMFDGAKLKSLNLTPTAYIQGRWHSSRNRLLLL